MALAVVLVLTLCSQVSRRYFVMLDGIYFICIYPNILFGKTGSFISDFVCLETSGLRRWRSPHNVACDHPSRVRQDQYAQTASAGCHDDRGGVHFIGNHTAAPAAPEASDEFWTLLSWIAALCVSRAAAQHLDPTKMHLKCIHQHCEDAHAECGAGRGCRAGSWCAKPPRTFFSSWAAAFLGVSGDARVQPALLQRCCKIQPERTGCINLLHQGDFKSHAFFTRAERAARNFKELTFNLVTVLRPGQPLDGAVTTANQAGTSTGDPRYRKEQSKTPLVCHQNDKLHGRL